MTIENLQKEMITAMKKGNKSRKTTISMLVAQIKKTAIDKGCRDDIPESLVNSELTKAKKQMEESIEGAKQANRAELLNEYETQYKVICEFAPSLIDDEDTIFHKLTTNYEGPKTKKDIMKWFNTNYRGKMDMKVAAMVADKFVKMAEA